MKVIITIMKVTMDFLRLLKNENARKVFGKRELKIIEKQLLGINLTQSEKNRLSRDIRKKLDFISDASRFSDEFNLKKGAKIKKMVEEAREVILADKLASKIKEIWLFGSAVENTLTFRSDIDIVAIFDEINEKEAFHFRARISGNVNDKIDIQVFSMLPEKVKKSILDMHKVLYKHGQNK